MSEENKDNKDIEMGVVNVYTKSNNEKCETDDSNDWNFGCYRLNKYCVQYFGQLGILSVCIAISLWKVSTSETNREFWASLLSGSVGYILPQPTLKKNN